MYPGGSFHSHVSWTWRCFESHGRYPSPPTLCRTRRQWRGCCDTKRGVSTVSCPTNTCSLEGQTFLSKPLTSPTTGEMAAAIGNLFDVKGRIALITGGSSGIGLMIAKVCMCFEWMCLFLSRNFSFSLCLFFCTRKTKGHYYCVLLQSLGLILIILLRTLARINIREKAVDLTWQKHQYGQQIHTRWCKLVPAMWATSTAVSFAEFHRSFITLPVSVFTSVVVVICAEISPSFCTFLRIISPWEVI